MLKTILPLAFALLLCTASFAQNVAINNDGTAPHSSALLDINHDSKGVLLPRVALTGTGDGLTVPGAAPSLLVYNTATAGSGSTAVTPGFYYRNGATWTPLTVNVAATAWLQGGNSGTMDGTNFIGTTDNIPFNVRVNNQQAGRIESNIATANTFIGYQAGNVNTGNENTAFGYTALLSNTTGSSNTANGISSLRSNTSGMRNTASGFAALFSNTTGYSNMASGANALRLNTTGYSNTASGVASLYNNTTGIRNSAHGDSTLVSNSTGNNNTAVGFRALQTNTTGSDNTAIGDSADVASGNLTNATAVGNGAKVNASNRVQIGNSAVTDVYFGNGTSTVLHGSIAGTWSKTGNSGTDTATHFLGTTDNKAMQFKLNNVRAGYLGTGSDGNVFWGYGSGVGNKGSGNIAIGRGTLAKSTTTYTVAIGDSALHNSTGTVNTAVGDKALFKNTTGEFNVGIGDWALLKNTTGRYNTANGSEALHFNTTGINNTASGGLAMQENTSGSNNTASGNEALRNNTTGTYNTALGIHALLLNTTGSFNTAIGADATVIGDDLTNATAIGYGAQVNVSNKVRVGNGNVTVIEGRVSFSTPSDKRFKYNVQANVPGLAFIQKLIPVTYYFNEEKLAHFSMTGELNTSNFHQAGYRSNRQLHTGFLAQDVEKVATELGYHFDGVHAPANDKDHYSLAYSQFIMPLVKAVQEQQEQIAEQKQQIGKLTRENQKIIVLETQLAELMKKVKALKLQ